MADHKHGEMDTSAQEHAFSGFVSLSTKVAIFSVCVLLFAAIVNG